MEKRIESARKYLSLVRHKFRDQTSGFEEFLKIMKAFKEQQLDIENVCKRTQELFKGHRKLLVEFNKLIPENYRINVESRPQYNEAIDYMRKVKEETKENPSVYSEFIRVLKRYQNKSMSIEEVNNSVRMIMVDYPTLVESFKVFLPNYYENSGSEEEEDYEPINTKPIKKRNIVPPNNSTEKIVLEAISEPFTKNEVVFFKRIKKIMELNSQPGTNYYVELIKTFELYSDSIITRVELIGMVEPLFKLSNYVNFLPTSNHSTRRLAKEENKDVILYIQNQLNECFEVFKFIAISKESSRRKHGWFFKPLSDFDTKKNKRHGHSYLQIQRPRIKKNIPDPEINEQWISVPYGSEDYSFRNFRRNIFEDALFKCEDERYELDIATENACYTLKLLEKSLDEANLLSPDQQKNYSLNEKVFRKIRLKPIYNIYSEHAPKIIEKLQTSPVRTLPVVISRIKSKIETWKKTSKLDSERAWKETIEKNFYKSLDHRSFYFKQNEKRMTNTKAFLSEAKQRYQSKEDCKNIMRRYLKNDKITQNFEFIGGSRNSVFFSSFAGLSGGVVHKVPDDFIDEIVEEFKTLDSESSKILYANAPEYSALPHFRLLFSCDTILFDSMRLILYALEKSNVAEKSKIDKIQDLISDFMGLKIPGDIFNNKVEEFFEKVPEEHVTEQQKPMVDVEITRKIISRWIHTSSYNEMEIEDSLSEILQDPITLKKDQSFVGYLPLLKDNSLIYAPGTLYIFIRFFYDIYERLLKIKLILSNSSKDQEINKIAFGAYKFDENTEFEYYEFLKVICMVLKGTYEPGKFEEKCRVLLGSESYIFFAFDKLINSAAKSLHILANDEIMSKAAVLYYKFNKFKLNEEMYLADFTTISLNSQIFRLHWNSRFSILSVTCIESPYDKLSDQSVKNAQKYKKHFLSSSGNNMIKIDKAMNIELNIDELNTLRYRFLNYLRQSDMTFEEYASSYFYYNETHHGMIENSYKFHYIPGGEDFMINQRYYGNYIGLENESDYYFCQDKNSLYQKLSEFSERRFKMLRDSWIYEQ